VVELRRDGYVQACFLVVVLVFLLEASLHETGSHEASALDGLYPFVLLLLATYVMLYVTEVPLRNFVMHSMVLSVALSVLPAVKYQFLEIGDVNYVYRIIETVSATSTYDSVSSLPNSLVGIYQNFPGFIILNVMFAKTTGLPVLEAYKLLFPVVYGIVYPTSFYLLSGLITNSLLLRRAVVAASVIPYALLPGAPWNYFMMPNYFGFLLFLPALYLSLRRVDSTFKANVLILTIIVAAIVVTHPLASVCIATAFSGIMLLRTTVSTLSQTQVDSVVSLPLVLIAWTAPIVWFAYLGQSSAFLGPALYVAIAAFGEGLRVPSVTQRLATAGPMYFLLTHVAMLAIGLLASIGLVTLVRKKISETKNGRWMLIVFAFLFLCGISFFALGYTLYDIYVGYRLLFLCMIGLTLAAGVGLFALTRAAICRSNVTIGKLRQILLGSLLLLILALSMFELYPTEYFNPSLVNPVHTTYEKEVLDFLNAYWVSDTQIVTPQSLFQSAQMYSSLRVYDVMVRPDFLPFVALRQPLTTVINNLNAKEEVGGNLVYNSGFMIVNSTLR
jgi:hypothetical protein